MTVLSHKYQKGSILCRLFESHTLFLLILLTMHSDDVVVVIITTASGTKLEKAQPAIRRCAPYPLL